MRVSGVIGQLGAAAVALVAAGPAAWAQAKPPAPIPSATAAAPVSNGEEKRRQTGDLAVTIVVSGLACTCTRFAEDIRNVVDDLRPQGQRVLPVLGVGGLQNLQDVLSLKTIDMGVVDEDDLRLLKKRDPVLYANLEQRVQYITGLYTSVFQVIARNDIRSFEDLRGRKVNFDLKDGRTDLTAGLVFDTLGIATVRSYDDNDVAIRKVIAGELAAMVILADAPQANLANLTEHDGVHLLPFDERVLRDPVSGRTDPAVKRVLADYVPAAVGHDQYPALIAPGETVPTIANRAVLVARAWPEGSERHTRLAKFVRALFGRIDQFRSAARHPKWSEIDIAADIPGWTRFKPAADWLAEQRQAARASGRPPGAAGDADLKLAFDRFLDQYAAARGSKTIAPPDQGPLLDKFQQFLQSGTPTGAR